MWDDVVIGSGPKKTSASAVLCTTKQPWRLSISANTASFWVRGAYLNAGLTIYKNTDEGQKLAQLLAERTPGTDASEIAEYLKTLVLSKATPETLERLIDEALHAEFRRGRDEKLHEIRQALEIT